MTEGPRLSVAVIGAAVSANKGAASMFYGLVEGLAATGRDLDIHLLTTYPDDDAMVLGDTPPGGAHISVVDASPTSLVIAFLLALPVGLLRRLRVPLGPLRANSLIAAVQDSSVVVDLAGIAFADGRGIPLLGYNVVMSLFPHLAGGRVVKASQAIGPARHLTTRMAARLVLPRMERICARGAVTRSHLDGLGLTNVVDAADIALLMSTGRVPDPLAEVTSAPRDGSLIVVMPSSVVDRFAARSGIDHVGVLAEVIDGLAAEGHTVLVVPHSFRRNGERGRMNDGPVVSDLAARTAAGSATFFNEDLDPRDLRAIIATADVAITGRFHGMVSALEVGTPPVVIGWSHKYGEVLDQFGVPDQGIAVADLTTTALSDLVHRTLDRRHDLTDRIVRATPSVQASSEVNIAVICDVAGTVT